MDAIVPILKSYDLFG